MHEVRRITSSETVLGALTLHYPDSDTDVLLDGDSQVSQHGTAEEG